MRRSLAALLIALGIQTPAAAKLLCPPGRFVLHPMGAGQIAALDGVELMLGAGDVAIGSACPRVRARWRRCIGRRAPAMRARFDFDEIYCTRLSGRLRVGRGPAVPFIAERVPVCGNNIRERGEQCDGNDGRGCCGADCRMNPGCRVACDARFFGCEAGEICAYACGFDGACWPREAVDCGGGPVCGCDQQTTHADRCAAWDAGTGVAYAGACRPAGVAGATP